MPLQIGITGGIGSGKSLVCRIFLSLGIPVYNADYHAKLLMTTDKILASKIQKEFGSLSYYPDGSLNRSYIADQAFRDKGVLDRLNSLVHPCVAEDYKHWLEGQQGSPYVLKEAALLFESGSHRSLDKVIMVDAPDTLRMTRVMCRDKHRTEEQVHQIMAAQLPEEEKKKRADFVLVNDEVEMLLPQVLNLHHQLTVLSALKD